MQNTVPATRDSLRAPSRTRQRARERLAEGEQLDEQEILEPDAGSDDWTAITPAAATTPHLDLPMCGRWMTAEAGRAGRHPTKEQSHPKVALETPR